MISQSLLPEFDHEIGTLRKYLDRFPEAQAAYKPHEKSMTMAQLASHLVEMVGWGIGVCSEDSYDITGYQPEVVSTRAALLAKLDENTVAARAALEKLEDADWRRTWSLTGNGHTMFAMPRIACFRSMIMNHIIHHRGQLAVYYRCCNVPVPSTYGPSGDEK
jgi:uncharacterized damage-inducible protein DinB